MKLVIIYAIFHQLILSSMVVCGSLSGDTAPGRSVIDKEPAFGVEFTLDHILSAVNLGNGSSYGLARIAGDDAYKSLMRRYLEICHQAHAAQSPPLEEIRQSKPEGGDKEIARLTNLVRKPEKSWRDYLAVRVFQQPQYPPAAFETDAYAGDNEVEVLGRAIGNLKVATIRELHQEFNITAPFPWTFANIVVPDFFYTATRPKPDPELQPDGIVNWVANFDPDSGWYHSFFRKFSTALYRNKFRPDGSIAQSDLGNILTTSAYTAHVRPASVAILSNARDQYCVNAFDFDSEGYCKPKTLSSTSIIVSFNNASLSLFLEGYEVDWTPWNTFTDLGGNAIASVVVPGGGNQNDLLSHWNGVLAKIDVLGKKVRNRSITAVDLIIGGESWNDETIDSFKQILANNGKVGGIRFKNVIYQPDVFAASKASATWGRSIIEDREQECQLPVGEMLPDPYAKHTTDEL